MTHSRRTIRFDPPGTDEEVLVFKHEWASGAELGPSITRAVAELTGRTPERVGTELGRRVDSDGLDRIFRPRTGGVARGDGRLVLSIASCEITVYSDGWVEVTYAPASDDGRE